MSGLLTIKVKLIPEDPVAAFGKNADAYIAGAQVVFRASIFKFLELLIRYGRRKTGRMVAGFTPMMDVYAYPYMRSWQHSDEENATDVQEGKNLGTFDNKDPWNISITNAVEYAEYVEQKVGLTHLGQLPVLIPYFEKYIGENFDAFTENAVNGGFDTGDYGNTEDFGAPETN